MVNRHLPHFSYPITRDVPWRVEPSVYLVALVVVVVLIPVNYALTGYETVPGTSQDYNYVPNRWYQRFAPRPTPGSYCDSYKFTIGDSFVTNSSILTYQLAAVLGDKEGSGAVSSIDYKGTSLQNCDVSTISVAADVRTETSTIMAEIACTSETDFPVIFTTSIVYSWFRDRLHSTSGRQENYQIGNMRAFNPLGMAVSALVEAGANDLIQYTLSVFENTANSPAFYNVPSLNSSDYPTWWCPVTTTTANSTCKTAIPEISLGDTTFLYANGTPAKGDGYASAATNAMNAMLPAVRIDLGNILPTNMLINRSLELINTTIVPTFPATISYNSTLYNTLTMAPAPDSTLAKIGDTEQYSSIIPVNYLCRIEEPKSPGSILVAVSVATLTLFKSGWAVFFFILTFWAKRHQPEVCVTCVGHEDLEAMLPKMEYQGSCSESTLDAGKLEKGD